MNEFIEYLDSMIAGCKEDIARLSAEGRKDDADFKKVRANIYEVVKTVTLALSSRPGAGIDAVRAQFARFKAAWGGALLKAKEHGDVAAAAVEEIKLDALEDAMAHFEGVTKA